MILKFTLMSAGVRTVTGRVYSKECLMKVVSDNSDKIKLGKFFCYNEKLEYDEFKFSALSDTRIINLYIGPEGNLVGELEILDTPYGRKLKRLLKIKKQIYCIPCGEGEVLEGGEVVNYSFKGVVLEIDETKVDKLFVVEIKDDR